MGPHRTAVASFIVVSHVLESVIALGVRSQRRVVLLGAEGQWCATPPATHELGRDIFGQIFIPFGGFENEVPEAYYILFQFAIDQVSTVTRQFWRRGHRWQVI